METPKVTTTLVALAMRILLAGPFLAGSPANSGGAEAIEPRERSLVGGDFTAKVVGSGDKLMGEGPCPIPLPPPYFLETIHWKAQR